MAKSIRERIMLALVALCDDDDKPQEVVVYRSPGRALKGGDLRAIAIFPEQQQPEQTERLDHDDGVERTMAFLALVRASDADIEQLYEDVDEVYSWIVTQLALDRTLGGLCEDIRETGITAWDVVEADETYIALTVRLEVVAFTSEDDPAAAA